MKKFITISTFLLLCSSAAAQITFEKTYGGTNIDFGWSIQQTNDNGYIIAGYTESFGAGNGDVYLIKTDVNGDTLWTKTYGGIFSECGNSVQQTDDNGYIICGETQSFGAGGFDVYLIKTDSNGDTVWTKTYGDSLNDYGNSVQQTNDNGYIIAGYTESFGAGNNDVYLIKTDANGDTLWTKTYGGTYNDNGFSVQQTNDNGYIITGSTGSFIDLPGVLYLIKTDANGDTLWTTSGYGNAGSSVQQTNDNGYIITGGIGNYITDVYNVLLVKTDANGDTLWTKIYDTPFTDRGMSIQQTNDNGYIIAGYYKFYDPEKPDVYLIKTNENGDTLWTKTYGGSNNDEGYSVQQTSDGGYIIAGYTNSIGAGSSDVYLIKTDENGEISGINNAQSSFFELSVYPNPAQYFTNIVYQLPTGVNKAELVFYDVKGNEVKRFAVDRTYDHLRISTAELSSGTYFYSLQTSKGIIGGKKMIIIR